MALFALFSAGTLVAGFLAAGGFALGTTTETFTETTATVQTTTEPGRTVVLTATVEQTTTQRVIVPATTTAESQNNGTTPTWVWVLVGLLAVGIVILIVVLLNRRGSGVSAEERSRRLDAAVRSWAAQGYALESQSADSAVVRRGGERMHLSVDATGAISSRPLATNDWPTSG